MNHYQYDVIIVGSGLAGLSVAMKLAAHKKVALLCKLGLDDGATDWAQGGIAAVSRFSNTDNTDKHIEDTLKAGAGLSDPEAVKQMVTGGENALNWLIEQGICFTQSGNDYHLTREGGHSERRIFHVDDATGHAVQSTLSKRLSAYPNITVLEHRVAVDVITRHKLGYSGTDKCVGLYVLNTQTNCVDTLSASSVVLATGGAGKVYLYTTNPDIASGDGIAIAWRAGAAVANMEFMQFHPTCLYHPYAKSFLISEALRGEGAVLRLPKTGERFMQRHDKRLELAPRDVVARAIDFEMKKHGLDYVFLDIRHQGKAFLEAHFPMIFKRCLEFGIDISKDQIPVVPAMHFTCGGVVTDSVGATTLDGLYAVGEVAYTGLHGANRLASNSLLECAVMGQAVAQQLNQEAKQENIKLPLWDESQVIDADEQVVITHNWDELRRCMWNYVGIVRTVKRLERAEHRVALLCNEIVDYYSNFKVSGNLLELRNLSVVASLIITSALQRKESRGLHYCLDYPQKLDKALPTILTP